MSWIKLTSKELKSVLANEEINQLNTTENYDENLLDIIAKNVASIWRAAILKQNVYIDRRDGFVPESLLVFILAHYRYLVFTRLPNMCVLNDDDRKKQYDEAIAILKSGLKNYSFDPIELDNIYPTKEDLDNTKSALNIAFKFDRKRIKNMYVNSDWPLRDDE